MEGDTMTLHITKNDAESMKPPSYSITIMKDSGGERVAFATEDDIVNTINVKELTIVLE